MQRSSLILQMEEATVVEGLQAGKPWESLENRVCVTLDALVTSAGPLLTDEARHVDDRCLFLESYCCHCVFRK